MTIQWYTPIHATKPPCLRPSFGLVIDMQLTSLHRVKWSFSHKGQVGVGHVSLVERVSETIIMESYNLFRGCLLFKGSIVGSSTVTQSVHSASRSVTSL